MDYATAAALPALCVLLGMLLFLEVGRWLGRRRRALVIGDRPEAAAAVIDGAIFALLGLLVAFTFYGASGRFDQRRALIVQEANAIRTTFLRLDLLAPEAQARLRPVLRDYAEARLAAARSDGRVGQQREQGLQGELWRAAVEEAPASGHGMLVLGALNQMFDAAAARRATTRTHVPGLILGLLFTLAFAAALVVGYAAASDSRRGWLRTSLFALIIAGSIFVILDFEYPRAGIIRLDAADRALEDVVAQVR